MAPYCCFQAAFAGIETEPEQKACPLALAASRRAFTLYRDYCVFFFILRIIATLFAFTSKYCICTTKTVGWIAVNAKEATL